MCVCSVHPPFGCTWCICCVPESCMACLFWPHPNPHPYPKLCEAQFALSECVLWVSHKHTGAVFASRSISSESITLLGGRFSPWLNMPKCFLFCFLWQDHKTLNFKIQDLKIVLVWTGKNLFLLFPTHSFMFFIYNIIFIFFFRKHPFAKMFSKINQHLPDLHGGFCLISKMKISGSPSASGNGSQWWFFSTSM